MTPRTTPFFAALVAALLALPAAAQVNGGFESGGLGSWTDNSAGAATVTNVAEQGFPSQGNFFLRLDAGSSNNATAGHGPHTGGGGLGNVVQVSRSFNRPAGSSCELTIDWTFRNEESISSFFNDFLSIDLIDVASNTLIANVVFVDTGGSAGTPAYTNVPGAGAGALSQVAVGSSAFETLPLGFKRAFLDLDFLTTAGQALRLDISVGNEGDSAVDSVAFIDNFALRVGGFNFGAVSTRLMSSEHVDTSGSSSQTAEVGPYEFRAKPGQKVVFRSFADSSGEPLALLGGSEIRLGTDFGFGTFNLIIPSLFVVFDGINPTDVADILLGTLANGPNFVSGEVPPGATDGQVAFQGIKTDPGNAFGLGVTSATNLIIDTTTRIPVATTDVLDSGGNFLADDDFGAVDLTPLTGGGFTFYGVLHTQVFANSNGSLTFGSGDTDFSESVNEFHSDQARIAGIWDDLNPLVTAGRVMADVNAQSARVTWQVRQFSSTPDVNHFTIELYANGSIAIYWECTDMPDGLVGISPGGLPVPTTATAGSNLSGFSFIGGNRFLGGAGQPIFQIFEGFVPGGATDRNDLMTFFVPRLSFVPDGAGGYEAFSGTR